MFFFFEFVLVSLLAPPGLLERLAAPTGLVPAGEAQLLRVAHLPKFLSEAEQAELRAAALEVRAQTMPASAHTAGIRREDGWHTTFFNQRLEELLPDLHARVREAMLRVDRQHWGIVDRAPRHSLNNRVAELHTVTAGGGIHRDDHWDYGSLLTLDMMLSDPAADFEGGQLQSLEPDGTLTRQRFERGDAVVFPSHKFHSVTPVTAGTRRVFVVELWDGLPRRCAQRCTDPWGACYCRYGPDLELRDGAAQCERELSMERVHSGGGGRAHSPQFVHAAGPRAGLPWSKPQEEEQS